MTTPENRPNTALLVIDVQNAAVERAHERDAVVANVGSLVKRARREGVPVVWAHHSDDHLARGSDAWQIVSELAPRDAEPLVEKNHGDSFEDTALEAVLAGLGVRRSGVRRRRTRSSRTRICTGITRRRRGERREPSRPRMSTSQPSPPRKLDCWY